MKVGINKFADVRSFNRFSLSFDDKYIFYMRRKSLFS